ncbi:MAG TPA: AglZ/HisF2 family acetamidino modification protein [Acidobacteriota bacterium]|nr:AglZ/HisF2 family acetamidino modification protein [Acidobacteriota bacterium]|tara:strand:+ start:1799 stop:2557 length:759 start_codon:yes stop_codon:yes gene_type:complete
MLRPRVLPALLLQGGRLVKTVRFRKPRYVGDPINAVRIFNEKEVDELIVIDIDAGRAGVSIPLKLITRIAGECFMPMTYGGGIRTLDQIAEIMAAGVEKVSVNRAAVADRGFVARAAKRFGSQSIVVSIDVRRRLFGQYEIYVDGGRRRTGLEPVSVALELESEGAGEILLTSINQEGTMTGYDVDLVRRVASAVSIPVIACGGAGSIDDVIGVVCDAGAAAAAVGSMAVYQGRNRGVLIGFPTRKQLAPLL